MEPRSPRVVLAPLTLVLAFALMLALAAPAHAETVPDVTGMSQREAEGLLEEAGFVPRLTFDPMHPAGLVYAQEPPGWSSREHGTPVEIRIGGTSPTPPPVTPPAPAIPTPTAPAVPRGVAPAAAPQVVPGLMGRPLAEARTAGSGMRLVLEQALSVPSMVGHVVYQWPSAGAPIPANETLTLVVGVEQRPSARHMPVPDVTGKSATEARTLLSRVGFLVNTGSAANGVVAVHHPLPGSLAPIGTSVRLEVGPSPTRPSAPPLNSSDVPMPMAPAVAQPPEQAPTPSAPQTTVPPEPARSAEAVTRPSPAGAPEVRGPAEDAVIGSGIPVAFDWAAVPGAATYVIELWREAADGTWSPVATATATSRPHRVRQLRKGRYRWRVGAAGQPFSSPRFLYVY